MNMIRETELVNPDTYEKVNNYLTGLGFRDSKDAFYKEFSLSILSIFIKNL